MKERHGTILLLLGLIAATLHAREELTRLHATVFVSPKHNNRLKYWGAVLARNKSYHLEMEVKPWKSRFQPESASVEPGGNEKWEIQENSETRASFRR